ncbi:MAG: DNA adenine methylase [Elusimicrobia bacterium]|nr:DNA adenine methylase [Elusimicrobiota bacterium]
MKTPHPIPYQGSKRNLSVQILAYFPKQINTLIEPFAGSGAITLAAAAWGLADHYHLNDLNTPLMELWRMIIEEPNRLARQYETIWFSQHADHREYYYRIRKEFNQTCQPHHFLYLLARCVKASVRYNLKGEFNQSPDNRRLGALPATVRDHILGASCLLKGRTVCTSQDYRNIVREAGSEETLRDLNSRNISYIVSYDGRTGGKVHGRVLLPDLQLRHIELDAGRSAQETLLGRAAVTYESLYLSPALAQRLQNCCKYAGQNKKQLALAGAVN